VTERSRQLYALYLTRFASGFGLVTLLTLLPAYTDLFDPSGFVIGMFTTGLALAQSAAVVPLAWASDRYDKRLVLLGSLGVAMVAYLAFVATSGQFIGARALQGIAVTGTGLVSLALVGELAPAGERATGSGRPSPRGSPPPSSGR
jgi:MFS family permease